MRVTLSSDTSSAHQHLLLSPQTTTPLLAGDGGDMATSVTRHRLAWGYGLDPWFNHAIFAIRSDDLRRQQEPQRLVRTVSMVLAHKAARQRGLPSPVEHEIDPMIVYDLAELGLHMIYGDGLRGSEAGRVVADDDDDDDEGERDLARDGGALLPRAVSGQDSVLSVAPGGSPQGRDGPGEEFPNASQRMDQEQARAETGLAVPGEPLTRRVEALTEPDLLFRTVKCSRRWTRRNWRGLRALWSFLTVTHGQYADGPEAQPATPQFAIKATQGIRENESVDWFARAARRESLVVAKADLRFGDGVLPCLTSGLEQPPRSPDGRRSKPLRTAPSTPCKIGAFSCWHSDRRAAALALCGWLPVERAAEAGGDPCGATEQSPAWQESMRHMLQLAWATGPHERAAFLALVHGDLHGCVDWLRRAALRASEHVREMSNCLKRMDHGVDVAGQLVPGTDMERLDDQRPVRDVFAHVRSKQRRYATMLNTLRTAVAGFQAQPVLAIQEQARRVTAAASEAEQAAEAAQQAALVSGTDLWRSATEDLVREMPWPYARAIGRFLLAQLNLASAEPAKPPASPVAQPPLASGVAAAAGSPPPTPQEENGQSGAGRPFSESAYLAVLANNIRLSDRLAFAVRFLPDQHLVSFVVSEALTTIKSGDVSGILITGLGDAGVRLLSSYLDRTGDLQTVALAACFLEPWRVSSSTAQRAMGWIQDFRDLLNRWRLWHKRAEFDVARAAMARRIAAEMEWVAINAAAPVDQTAGGDRSQEQQRPWGPRGGNPDPAELSQLQRATGAVAAEAAGAVGASARYRSDLNSRELASQTLQSLLELVKRELPEEGRSTGGHLGPGGMVRRMLRAGAPLDPVQQALVANYCIDGVNVRAFDPPPMPGAGGSRRFRRWNRTRKAEAATPSAAADATPTGAEAAATAAASQGGRAGGTGLPAVDPVAVRLLSVTTTQPPQVAVRCVECGTTFTLPGLLVEARSHVQWLSEQRSRVLACVKCRKTLPRCALCLLPMGTINPYLQLHHATTTAQREPQLEPSPGDALYDPAAPRPYRALLDSKTTPSQRSSVTFGDWWTWCSTCRHGGHAAHLAEWFTNHDICPVARCACRCNLLDPAAR